MEPERAEGHWTRWNTYRPDEEKIIIGWLVPRTKTSPVKATPVFSIPAHRRDIVDALLLVLDSSGAQPSPCESSVR